MVPRGRGKGRLAGVPLRRLFFKALLPLPLGTCDPLLFKIPQQWRPDTLLLKILATSMNKRYVRTSIKQQAVAPLDRQEHDPFLDILELLVHQRLRSVPD